MNVMRSLKVKGKHYFDVVPCVESLFSSTVLGANSACGLGSPADWGSWDLADAEISRALPLSAQQASVRWHKDNIQYLSEQTCPFCEPEQAEFPPCKAVKKWAVFAFWKLLPKVHQDHVLSLCSSTWSTVTSLAVCMDSNWTSETAGHLTKLYVYLCGKLCPRGRRRAAARGRRRPAARPG